ncbi:MAG: NAD(P)(+) transhydrogenase (Re/Si-specific) subunit beta [Deltaproteobacteria bacterium]|nr:NAD(P)(+) transhydrogenase (Re/Si-specific) subunit beta [Deltaproteobacteria bacterium]
MIYSLSSFLLDMGYLAAASCFIIGLKYMSSPKTAQRGNLVGAGGMALGVVLTLADPRVFATPTRMQMGLIAGAIIIGSLVGVIAAKKVQMTEMPQMVAIFNGVGGAASVFVAGGEFTRLIWASNTPDVMFTVTGGLSVLIGAITVTGSGVAFAKLQGWMTSAAISFPGMKIISGLLFIGLAVGLTFFSLEQQSNQMLFWGLTAVSALLGILLVIPIGGADMPVVISLLNSYSGLAAAAAGFVVGSKVLIVSGSLVGASGIILTRIMCQAMNRSLTNVIFGAFGAVAGSAGAAGGEQKPMKEFMPMDAAIQLTNASSVIVVPGYGLAVSQAQNNLRELADFLESEGVEVKYAIHPVAGRMPGHMNVLLAEANIPYEQLCDLDDINGEFETTDVCVVIGANDVTNPSARDDKSSPLYGMPILNCDKARTVIVLKRGRGAGFAGVENPLFTADNTGLVFGDAKKSLTAILNEAKEL